MNDPLEQLYREAQSAIKAGQYVRAADLLKQILVVDENYRDSSRLLAQTVERKRRRWYRHPALWVMLGLAAVIGPGIWFAPRIPPPATTVPTSTIPTEPTLTFSPTSTALPTEMPTLAPTVIPLTWKRISIGLEFQRDFIDGLVIDPKDPNLIYVNARNAGFFRSVDGGDSWRPINRDEINGTTLYELQPPVYNNSLNDKRILSYKAPDGNIIFYRICPGFNTWCISLDDRKTWQQFSEAGEFSSAAITFDAQGMVYLVCGQNICMFAPDGTLLKILGYPRVGHVNLLRISQSDPNTLYAAGEGLAVSTDGGHTWKKINNGLGITALEMKAGYDGSSVLYLLIGDCISMGGERGGSQPLYRSRDNGVTWELITKEGCQLTIDANGHTLYRLNLNGPVGWGWFSNNNGTTWLQMDNLSSEIDMLIAHPETSGLLLASDSQSYSQRYVSNDHGSSWKYSTSFVGACYGATIHFLDAYKPMSLDPQDGNHVIYVENNRIFESNDGCATDPEHDLNFSGQGKINSVAIGQTNNTVFYVGTDTGAYASFDKGQTWGQINNGLLGATVVYSIVVDKDGNVFAATPYGIFKLEAR